jgi:hypothetical protein
MEYNIAFFAKHDISMVSITSNHLRVRHCEVHLRVRHCEAHFRVRHCEARTIQKSLICRLFWIVRGLLMTVDGGLFWIVRGLLMTDRIQQN